MSGEEHESDRTTGSRITLSAPLFWVLIGGALTGGTSLGGFVLGPQAETRAAAACYDNSSNALELATRAIGVAADQSKELVTLEQLILDRTAERWTENDHRDYEREQQRENSFRDREIQLLKESTERAARRLDSLERAARSRGLTLQSVPDNE